MYELLLGYLAYTRRESDPIAEQYHSLMALLERNLDKQAGVALEKYRALLDRRNDRTADWHRHALRYWEAGEMLHSRQPRRTAGEHLRRQVETLFHTHILEKLQLSVAMLSRNTLAVLGPDEMPQWQNDLQEVRSDKGLIAALPVAEVYFAAQDLLLRPSPETFVALTTGLDTHHPHFQKDELNALYQCALNYCIRRINDGRPEAYNDALALYRTLLDRGLLLQNGRLSQWTYKNIATTGLRNGAFDWTEKFLTDYRDALLPAERDNAFAFNLATLYFEKQDFTHALRTLQNVEFTDITYHVGAKILQLKSFYLLDETEALQSLLDATERWLRRNKSMSAFGKTTNLHFLMILRQLNHWKQKKGRISAVKLEKERLQLFEKVTRLQPLANRDWILRVMEESA
ncbi:MAG: hypothetical protein IPJ82_13815 [Lewinellaceae bacterium]|nr:hypothetical protein [Lewinellaceae bacterium]